MRKKKKKGHYIQITDLKDQKYGFFLFFFFFSFAFAKESFKEAIS